MTFSIYIDNIINEFNNNKIKIEEYKKNLIELKEEKKLDGLMITNYHNQ